MKRSGSAPVPTPSARKEHVLVRRAALGDREAFDDLVRAHSPMMYRCARLMTAPDPDLAQDVTQEALVRAWQQLPRFDGRSALSTWLYRITVNTAHNHLRRRRALPVEDEVLEGGLAPVVGASGAVQYAELRDALRAVLAALPWRQRVCWVMREVEGARYAEIAAALGVSDDVVRGQLARARTTVAARMEAWR